MSQMLQTAKMSYFVKLCRIITLQLHAEDLEVERPPIQLRIKKYIGGT